METTFNKSEKMSIFKLLLDMMKADNDVAINEFIYLKEMKSMLNISTAEIKLAKSMSVLDSLSNLSELSNEAKKEVLAFLHKMLKADGIVNRNEVKLLKMVSKLFGVPSPNI